MSNTLVFILSALVTFVITVISARILIPILRSHKMGQKILDVGPRWHKSKEGTPTMGGLSFIIASSIALLTVGIVFIVINHLYGWQRLIICFVYALANGAIGVIDDRVKLLKKQNEGLSAGQKYALQFVAAAIFLFAMTKAGAIGTKLYIPYTGVYLKLGWLYYVVAILVLTGIVNSANLTDGVDGLASSVALIIAIFFAVASFIAGNSCSLILSALTIGSTLGFLVYNFYPARVFMGDTGSLFLGALVVSCGFLLDNPVIVLIAGLLYLIESLSVIIQVSYFKLTHGKRFFKMAPIHHHFEKCGWSEIKVVAVFSLFTALCCFAAYFGL